MPHLPMPDAELLLERGQDAADLMRNDAFNNVVADLSNDYLAQMVAAKPGPEGAEALAYAHLMHHALQDLLAVLVERVAAAAELQANLTTDPDEDA